MSAILGAYRDGYADQIYAVTVGSEALYRKEYTGAQLADLIKDARSKLPPGVKVGTADSWHLFDDGTADALIPAADILLCNAFSYWQGQDIGNATYAFLDDVGRAFGRIAAVSGSRDRPETWVGETGWPSDGTDYQRAEVGLGNAHRFYDESVCLLVRWGYKVFAFEAFDEAWKPKSVGLDGKEADETHWGVMNGDRSLKYSLQC
jgi:glucan 1,3-beta-glucosidase